MIRRCAKADFEAILAVINDAARAYDGVIPADRYHEPYMPAEELRGEIEAGVNSGPGRRTARSWASWASRTSRTWR